jgi:hypothetical protein
MLCRHTWSTVRMCQLQKELALLTKDEIVLRTGAVTDTEALPRGFMAMVLAFDAEIEGPSWDK